MSTELAERPKAIIGSLITVTDETIEQMAARMLVLKVNGIADKKGFELCDAARKECVKARTGIAAEHKERKEESLRICQTLDADKRRLTAKVEEIEAHLVGELEVVKKEEARLKKEKEDAVYAIRLQMLTAAGGSLPESIVRAMSEAQFATAVEEATVVTQRRKEAEAKAAEQAEANRIESERLAAERAEFQRQQAEQAAERQRIQAIEDERIQAQRAQLEAQRQEQVRQAAELQAEKDRLEKIEADRLHAAETAERVRIETEERIKREALVAEQNHIAEEAAKKRADELRPAKAKLNELAHKILTTECPAVSGHVDQLVRAALNTAAETIRKIAKDLN